MTNSVGHVMSDFESHDTPIHLILTSHNAFRDKSHRELRVCVETQTIVTPSPG
jgi:hypothetical protein